MDKFNALEIFSAVAREKGFAAAARSIGTDPSTISKAIDRLEQDIGFRLFQRSTRTIRITPEGERYLQHTKTLIHSLNATEDAIRQEKDTPTGTLKINAPVSYGRLYIVPILNEFKIAYPHINIDLSLNDAYTDIIDQGFDLSIRSGSLQDNRLVARKLSAMDLTTIASPKVAETMTETVTHKNVKTFKWLQFRFRQTGKLLPIQYMHNNELCFYEPKPEMIVDDGEALLAFCIQGLGLTQLPHFLVKKAIESKQIVTVMNTITAPFSGIYAIYPKRESTPKRVQVFIAFLQSKLTTQGEGLEKTWALDLRPF